LKFGLSPEVNLEHTTYSVERALTNQEFLSATGQDTIPNAILDSLGLQSSSWWESAKVASGYLNPCGIPIAWGLDWLSSVLGQNDCPFGLVAQGDGNFHAEINRAATTGGELSVTFGAG
jgi:hypothetical protein